jgi:ubiquinone/menaquinone biosynthesis C-methylase UbiE
VRRALLLVSLWLVAGCGGLAKLDWSALGRDFWQRPDDVIEALELRGGERVADLGAGDGYFVAHLARAVGPEGVVFAVDIDAELMLELATRFPPGETNVEAILGDADDPRLPDASLDLVLIVNTYHHIDGREAYFRALARDLRPGGRVAIIEPNEDLQGILRLFLDEGHTSAAGKLEQEMERAGYRVTGRPAFLPVQIFRVFAPATDGS